MEFFAVVETDHRAHVGVADATLVIVRAIVDVQAHVVERQQCMKPQAATQYLLFGDPDKPRRDGGDAQVDVGHLVAGVIAQAIGQVVADKYLSVGAGWRQDTHAVDFDAHRPGRHTAFGCQGL
ncbi:hypothetical protein D3C80_1284610 [compost metagenome]